MKVDNIAHANHLAGTGEVRVGGKVTFPDGARWQLTGLGGNGPQWQPLHEARTVKTELPAEPEREVPPHSPRAEFAGPQEVRQAVRCGAIKEGAEFAFAQHRSLVCVLSRVDRAAEEFTVTRLSDGLEAVWTFYGRGGRAAAPAARTLPTDSAARKEHPIAEGVLYYFPAALAAVSNVSKRGNDQHNPGQALHHARGKSTDHTDCLLRHLIDAREAAGAERTAELAAAAWRALALLQEHCESEGAPRAPNAR